MARTLSTTTLTGAVTTTFESTFPLASVTGITADTLAQHLGLFVDQEFCFISRVEGLNVTVRRGEAGSAASTHAVNAVVYYGFASDFYQTDPIGVPPTPPMVTPWINTITGVVWTVSGTTWVTSAQGGLAIGSSAITGGLDGQLLYDNAGVLGELVLGTNLSLSGNQLNAAAGSATVAVTVTTVTGGTSGRVFYDNAGFLGEMTNTGTGSVNVLQNAPTFISPALGTPTSGVLSGCSGYAATALTGTLAITHGGTGQTTYTNGQLLIGNTSGNTLTKATLTAGTNITITNGNGSITIDATGGISGLTIGSTTITSGTTGRVLYDAAGVVGEMTTTGSGTVLALATSPSFTTPALGAATGASVTLTGVAAAAGFNQTYITKTADYTLTTADGTVELLTNAATFTLPTAVGVQGRIYVIKNKQTVNACTVDATGAQTIDGSASVTLSAGSINLQSDGVNWRLLSSLGADIGTLAQGDLLYASAANVISTLTKDGNATRYLSNTGTANDPAWAQVDVATGVTGVLPYANLVNATAASILVGRGADAGAGVFQEVTLGANLTMTGTVLSATGGTAAITVGSSTITSGNNTRILYNNSGILGEYTITGTGTVVAMKTSPVFVTPALGTPSSGVLSSCTGYAATALTGDLLFANLTPASAANLLLGRGSAGGAGDYQEITLGSGLTMTNQVLSSSGGSSGITIGTTTITTGTTTSVLYDNAGVVGEYTLTGSGSAVAMGTSPSFVTSALSPLWTTASGAAGSVSVAWAAAPGATTTPGAGQSTVAGGAMTLIAGNAVASPDTASAAAGGAVTITTGNAARLSTGNSAGGAFTVLTGTGIGTTASGAVSIQTGINAGGATGQSTGNITVTSGAGSVTGGNSGHMTFSSGAGTSASGTGNVTVAVGTGVTGGVGNLILQVGDATGTAAVTTGDLRLLGSNVTGTKTSSTGVVGGIITQTAGSGQPNSGATGVGGSGGTIILTTGAGGAASGASGTAGAGGAAGIVGGVGGAASGATSVTGGAGGSVSITAGAGGATTTATTRVPGVGGDIVLNSGAAGTGHTGSASANGSVIIKVAGTTVWSAATAGITITGALQSYNGIATVGWGAPVIYGTGRSTAQTAAVATVATYTVGASDGSFLVSANVLVTTSSAEAFTVTCAYTDESNAARTATLGFALVAGTAVTTSVASANGAVPYMGRPQRIRCKAATAITIATTGTFTGATYNVEGDIMQVK